MLSAYLDPDVPSMLWYVRVTRSYLNFPVAKSQSIHWCRSAPDESSLAASYHATASEEEQTCVYESCARRRHVPKYPSEVHKLPRIIYPQPSQSAFQLAFARIFPTLPQFHELHPSFLIPSNTRLPLLPQRSNFFPPPKFSQPPSCPLQNPPLPITAHAFRPLICAR